MDFTNTHPYDGLSGQCLRYTFPWSVLKLVEDAGKHLSQII